MSLATEAMPETRLHFCHFPAVLNVFFKMWNDNEKPRKIEKREVGKNRWYNQMKQVGTG